MKNLTTAEGGAVTWNELDGVSSDEIYKRFMLLSLHGQSKDALAKSKSGAWEYYIADTNYKCNMTDIMAAIGLAQLKRYEDMLSFRHQIINMYNEGLQNLPLQVFKHKHDSCLSSGHLYLTRLIGKDDRYRNEIIQKMAER